jgi:hypothetical protein
MDLARGQGRHQAIHVGPELVNDGAEQMGLVLGFGIEPESFGDLHPTRQDKNSLDLGHVKSRETSHPFVYSFLRDFLLGWILAKKRPNEIAKIVHSALYPMRKHSG